MTDPGLLTGLTVAGVYAAKKVLGPSLDALGQALGRLTEYRTRNLGRVVENAAAKLPAGDAEGAVPPRVAIRMLEEGSYADDDVVVEYLGGVLASSWSPTGRDDRGAAVTALVSRLSSYALRAHFIIYSECRRVLLGSEINLGLESEAQARARVFIPHSVFVEAMDFSEGEDMGALMGHALQSLYRERLIGDWTYGVPGLFHGWPESLVALGGLEVAPSASGAELFLWGMGRGTMPVFALLDPETELEAVDLEISIPASSRSWTEVQAEADRSGESPANE